MVFNVPHQLNRVSLRIFAPALAVLILSACAGTPGAPENDGRGSDTTATTEGQLNSVQAYAVAAHRALEYLPDGESIRWVDPADGRALRLIVLSTHSDAAGIPCRLVVLGDADAADGVSQQFCRDAQTNAWQFVAIDEG